jgi:hypothetical protein
MGWSILLYNSIGVYMQDDSLYVSNLTYNYSVPECMKYWYGPRDYGLIKHGSIMVDRRLVHLKKKNNQNK